MGEAADAGGEDFAGDDEGCGVGTEVEEELREGKRLVLMEKGERMERGSDS